MARFLWKLHDASGEDMRVTEAFSSQEEAEAWLGDEWASLAEEGAESVSLMRDAEELYRMGLGAP